METAKLKLIQDILSFVDTNIITGVQIVKGTSHSFLSDLSDMVIFSTDERISAMITLDMDTLSYLDIGVKGDGKMVRLSPKGLEKLSEGHDQEALDMYLKLQKRFGT